MKSTSNVVKRLLTFAAKTEILKKKDNTLLTKKIDPFLKSTTKLSIF